jgi:hypothetical protein
MKFSNVVRLLACITFPLTLTVNALAQPNGFDPLLRTVVTGVVFSRSGKPVAQARVRLDGPVHLSAVTRTNGAFAFTRPPLVEGTYTLTVEASGFARLTLRHLTLGGEPVALGRIELAPSLTALKVIGSAVARERLPFNSTPASVKVFPREAYRDQGQASVATVLSQTPGAVSERSTGENAAQPQAPFVATVRGGLPFETALLIDGNPVSLPSSGTFDLAYLPSFVLQDVEILKGQGSAESTIPNAIDGAINLRTTDPGTTRKALLEVEADSRGGQFSDLAYGGTAGRFSFASMLAIDGNPGPATHFNAAGEALQRAELLKARYQLSNATSATATYLGSEGTLGVAVARGYTLNNAFLSFANAPNARETHRMGLYDLELQSDSGLDHLTARAYTMQLQRSGGFDPVAYPGIGSGIDVLDNATGFSLQDDHQIANNLYEIEGAYRSGAPSARELIPVGAHSDQGLLRAAAILHPNPAWDLQLAAAALAFHERYSHDSGASFSDATLWTPVFHAGASAHVLPNLTARFSMGTGAAAPPAAVLNTDPADLFAQTPAGSLPYTITQRTAPQLSLETSFGYDAGVEYRLHGDTTTFSADLYHTIVHGPFVDGSASGVPVQYTWFNGPAMTHEGLEVSLQQFKRVGLGFIAQAAFTRTYVNSTSPALYSGPSGAFTANLGIVRGQNISGGAPPFFGTNDVSATRVPYAQAYTEISYKWPRGSRLSLGALYYGANNPYARPAFATLNSNLELSVGALSKFQLSVENLTNAYGGSLPLGFAGVPVALANGTSAGVNAGVLTPFTVRVMFRQSIGPGAIFEH